MGWHAKKFADLCIGRINHPGFYGSKRSAALAHIEEGGCAAPNDGRTRPCQLMDGYTRETFCGVLRDRAKQCDRSGCARKRHGYDLCRHPPTRPRDEVPRAKV